MDSPASDVRVNIATSDGRIATTGGGALQIRIDGTRLNRYRHEDEAEGSLGWHGYTGDDVVADLQNVVDETAAVIETAALYEPRKVRFAGYDDYLVLERLSDDALRIAYRVTPNDERSGEDDFRVVPWSACGAPVETTAWVTALRDAVVRLQEALRENDEPETADWFEDVRERLDSLLE